MNARELALNSLLRTEKENRFSNLESAAALENSPLSPADRKLYAALYFGVIERRVTLDWLISLHSRREAEKISKKVRNILRLGLYQLFFTDRIPQSAAVNESVRLAKSAEPASAGFVNAVLRAACRAGRVPLDALGDSTPELSKKFSYPEWMISLWRRAYGDRRAVEIMEQQNVRSPLFLRVNTLRTDRERLKELLEKEGFEVSLSPICDTALTVGDAGALIRSPLFEKGLFFVQDAASQLACRLLDPKPGQKVADVCACPGGKSFSAAILMENRGSVLSLDLHSSKLPLIEVGAKRLGLGIITSSAHDSSTAITELAGSFDRVICDVPCSGLGVIAKKPDIRSKNESDVHRLPEIQTKILDASAEYLRPGGILLYSTCTLNPDENEKITNAFLGRRKDFARVSGQKLPMTLFPRRGENDGFFIDLLIRTE